MNHWLWGYYEILPQILRPLCDLRWKIIWLRHERRWSTPPRNLNSTPKTCQSEAAKHLLHEDSNVFPHADTIATFQFQLHLKPPISAAAPVIEIWNPAYIQVITASTRPQLLCACPGKWEGKNNRDQIQPEHISIYLLFNNVELAPDPQQQLTPTYPLKKMATLLNQGEIKHNPWGTIVRKFKSDTIWGISPLTKSSLCASESTRKQTCQHTTHKQINESSH